MTPVVVLLAAGLAAMGLPRITRQTRRRAWHPWVQGGLLPLIIGIALGQHLGWNQAATADDLLPVLALATAAGGLLIGTQLRLAYLARAGGTFLRRHSRAAAGAFLFGAVPASLVLVLVSPLSAGDAIAWSAILGGMLVVCTQRPPTGAGRFDVGHRDVVLGHVAPSGWWNVVAVALVGLVVAVVPATDDPLAQVLPPLAVVPVRLGVPIVMGVALGWLASRARNREEVALCVLAVVGLSGGLGLLLGAMPLFTGLVVGAVFANLALGRAAMVERMLEELEQPVVVTCGLLGGVLLALPGGQADWWAWLVVLPLLPVRWLSRRQFSPTAAVLAGPGERALSPPGACAILLIGSLSFVGHGAEALVLPLTGACALGLLVAQAHAARLRARS